MTAVLERPDDVIEATPEQVREAVRSAIRASGFSYRELLEQAKVGDFKTTDARKSWVVLGGLDSYVDEVDR